MKEITHVVFLIVFLMTAISYFTYLDSGAVVMCM